MIYELRIYTLKPGAVGEYLTHQREVGRPVRGDKYGRFVGGWTTEFGTLNRYVHLWEYASLDERQRLREALSKDSDWTTKYVPRIQPLLMSQENMLLALDPEVGLREPEGGGHVYELRTYRTQPGKVNVWKSLLKGALPAREKYSKIVGLWTTEVAQLNQAVHLWVYDDLNQRAQVRATVLADPVWSAFVPKSSALLVEMSSTILIPTDTSPMR
ncbi:MAG: NIPSNAP family protein [Chloroflexi bacterium]|nr:NIPSNAP family protein [Chloroflexota bacterium]